MLKPMKPCMALLAAVLLLLSAAGCKKEIAGCTDPTATNYNPDATVDNGNCSYIRGCTDPTAYNYDPSATQDDGSCRYSGQVAFWQSGTPSYNVTDVTIGGITHQITQNRPNGIGGCEDTGCANFTLEVGSYNYTAQETGLFGATWNGTVTITKNQCLRFELY